jgi:oligosaccharide translocation protein RFT1
MAEDAVSASARGATFLILLQVGTRAVTFALNQALLRFLSPKLLGAAVQLELYKISTLLFSRESLRIATQRRSGGGVQAAVNMSYIAIASGVPIGLLFAHLYLQSQYPDVPYFAQSLRINEIASLVELCSEPAFVAVQQKMLYKTQARTEATAIVFKTIATASVVLWGFRRDVDTGVLPFAMGELSNSVVLSIMYLWQVSAVAGASKFSLLPTKIPSRCVVPCARGKFFSLIPFQ